MISSSELNRFSGKLTSYIHQYVTLAALERKEEMTGMFNTIHRLFPYWVIMSCPVMHPDIRYVSKNSAYIFGSGYESYELNTNATNFFNNVHEADQQDLLDCFRIMHDFMMNVLPEQHFQYRCIFYYRFRKTNGQYIYLHDEKAVVNLNGSGNFYFALMKDLTPERRFEGVKLEIYKLDPDPVKLLDHKPLHQRNKLTKRETDLVTLIKQGLSTKEIAWYLNISHNTVRNIKSRLFEKYNVTNTIELLNLTS
jgi:DNA-binding CsgD family transcriptional regulator